MNKSIFLFLFFAVRLFAQGPSYDFSTFNPQIEIFKIPGGETANSVQCMVQDSTGFLWFATQDGLSRFDGTHFKSYRPDPVNPNSLPNNYVETIFLDSKGILWLTHWNNGGLTAFDPTTETFTKYQHDPKNPESLGSETLSVVAEDKQGYLWVGGQSGLDRLDRKTGKFKHFQNDPSNPRSLSHNQVRALYVDRQGVLWVGTGTPWDNADPQHKQGGLNRYDARTESFIRYMHDPNDPQSLNNNKVRALLEDRQGNFWVGTAGDGLHRMNRQTGKFERLRYDPAHPEKLSRPYLTNLSPEAHGNGTHITSLFEDDKGLLWITAALGGLNVFDPVSGKTRHFDEETGHQFTTLWQVYQTRDGTLWLTSAGEGKQVFKITQKQKLFPFFSDAKIPGNTYNYSHGIVKDREGSVWMAYENPGQIIKVNRKTGQVVNVPIGDPKKSLDYLTGMSLDREGKVWVGGQGGQYWINSQTGVSQPLMIEGMPAGDLRSSFAPMLHTKSGMYLLGGDSPGLTVFDPRSGSTTNYKHDSTDVNSIGGDMTWGFYEDTKGNLWIGGGGLYWNGQDYLLFLDRFNPKTKTFEHFIKDKTQVGSASYITEDNAGNIWFTDGRYGFQKLDPKTGVFKKFTPGNSLLPSPHMLSIMKANDGKLWLSDNYNLIEFDPVTEAMAIYGEAQGIRAAEGYFGGAFVAEDGELLFSRMGGFHAFYPDQFAKSKRAHLPDLRITGFHVLNDEPQPKTQKPIWQNPAIELNHRQNVFSFSVACFDFAEPGAVQIQFMLEGFDRAWRNDLRDGETPTYVSVPPGTYTFRVRGANSLGVWNMEGISMPLTILPPWWQTWWAYVLYVLAAVAIIWGFIRWRSAELERKNKVLEEKVQLRTQQLEQSLVSLQATQSQLIQSEKLASLGELTAGIAHEIQNPLNFVNNFSELSVDLAEELKEEIKKPEKDWALIEELTNDLSQNQQKINLHGKRASSIVTGMLQHARTSTGKKEPTDINALADEYLRLSYHGLRAKDSTFNAKMTGDFDPAVGKVDVIPQDIGRVLLNLINNAFYAVSQRSLRDDKSLQDDSLRDDNPLQDDKKYEPTVIVSTKKLGDKVEIRVQDNGTGIPDSVKAKIFQPFFTTKPTGQGTGLGLSLAYDIVTKGHGGTLEVESTEGYGTVFVIHLPFTHSA